MKDTIHIAILAYDGVETLDVTGPLEVLHKASEYSRKLKYNIHLIGIHSKTATTRSGLTLQLAQTLSESELQFHTIVIPGGSSEQVTQLSENTALCDWLIQHHQASARLVSICTGAFILAATGLLSGRRATTHWASIKALRDKYPDLHLQEDAIFVKDGNLYTSAGITAGMDLALALVEEDLNKSIALSIAQNLVMYAKRPAHQGQLSTALHAQFLVQGKLQQTLDWALANLKEDLSVEALAHRASMSPRTFARRFKRETGSTPAKVIEAARVQYAKTLLANNDIALKTIANLSGFGSEETMRRAFQKVLYVSPGQYRENSRQLFND